MNLSPRFVGLILVFCIVGAVATLSGEPAQTRERNPSTLLTLVLHQTKDQSVEEFQQQLRDNHFQQAFPPDGVEIVSWTGVVGMGYVITMRLPNYKVPEVRHAINARKWGDITPKLYSAYDFEPFWHDMGGQTNSQPDRYAQAPPRMLIAP